ncbi:MAG: cyclic nucleotide-binding domain-containing protein [Candidatus Wallbacteria bacterium]|nr:cyclic nucleotide-binding domain-containing protein [Candidatus Wallbacteria bacterium]
MIEKIKELSLFRNLSRVELEAFLPIIKENQYTEGQNIFQEGEEGTNLFIIEKGCVEIRKLIDPAAAREKTLATVREGSFFGEMALYSDKGAMIRSASAYAVADSTIFEIEAGDYLELIKANPGLSSSLSRAIITTLSDRLRNTSRELVVLYETGKLVGTIKDADQLSDALVKHLKEALKAEMTLFAIHNPYSDRVEVKSSLGFQPQISELDIKPGVGILGNCFLSGQPIICSSFTEEDAELTALMLPGFDINSILCVPLMTDQKSIGLIFLADTTKNFYGDSEINLMIGVSRQVATAIENAFFHLEDRARRDYQKQYIMPGF